MDKVYPFLHSKSSVTIPISDVDRTLVKLRISSMSSKGFKVNGSLQEGITSEDDSETIFDFSFLQVLESCRG